MDGATSVAPAVIWVDYANPHIRIDPPHVAFVGRFRLRDRPVGQKFIVENAGYAPASAAFVRDDAYSGVFYKKSRNSLVTYTRTTKCAVVLHVAKKCGYKNINPWPRGGRSGMCFRGT